VVLRERGDVAAPPAEPRERAEGEPLDAKRRERQVHLVEVLVEEDGDLEQRACTEPGYSDAPVGLQAEEGAQALLAAARRAQLDQEVSGGRAGVPEAMRRPGRHDDGLAGPEPPDAATEPEAELPRDPGEPFPLGRVHVRRDEAARTDEELAADDVRRSHAEDDRLAGDRVGDGVVARDGPSLIS
jgi:hypothetical protein